ncbi:MAG: hypothetical protein HQK50_06420 [Oligoflexia bacterium]|nr:hypothetical protein [Oligoflexia bacterium]
MNRILFTIIVLIIFGLLSGCKRSNSTPGSNLAPPNPNKCPSNQIYDKEHDLCIDSCGFGMRFDYDLKKCISIEATPVVTPTVAPTVTPILECTGNSYPDSSRSKCIPGMPLLVFPKDESILPDLVSDKNPSICIDVDEETQSIITEDDFSRIVSSANNAINIWLSPLIDSQFSSVSFSKDIKSYKSSKCKIDDYTLIIHVVSEKGLVEICNNDPHALACANVTSHQTWFPLKSEFHTYLHEFGHLLGFDDHYNTKAERPEDFRCKKGYDFNTTVMCYSEGKLKPADIEGIKRQYCRFWSNTSECQANKLKKLTDFDNGTFITCKNEKEKYKIVNDYYQIRFIDSFWLSDKFEWSTPHEVGGFLPIDELDHYPWVIKSATATDNLIVEVDFANDKVTIAYGLSERTVSEFSIKKDCDISNDFLLSRIKGQFPGLL